MGCIRHHAIVVTSAFDDAIEKAHAKAKELFTHVDRRGVQVTDITTQTINGYRSFLVPPDGSKEGWLDSDNGDEARDQFIAFLRDGYEHHKLWVDWVEIEFGGDNAHRALIIQGTHIMPVI